MRKKIALFGGVYSNYLSLKEVIKNANKRNADSVYCLGDIGAFGPNPAKVFPILIENNIQVVQGNYDNSIGNNLNDCQCGYTDPRDNYYAKLSYDYTFRKTPEIYKKWMKKLPGELRFEADGYKVPMQP